MNDLDKALQDLKTINNRLQRNNDRTVELIEKVKKLNERRAK